jgi:hypothetical protein
VQNAVFVPLDTSLVGDFLEFRAEALKSTANTIAVTRQPQKIIGGDTAFEQQSGADIFSIPNGCIVLTVGIMSNSQRMAAFFNSRSKINPCNSTYGLP